MPSGLAPLCPSCLDRALAWTAAACPSCRKRSPVAACDHCRKSRAGSFLPEDAKSAAAAGGAQRFVCVDCMEQALERDVSDWMRNSAFAVVLTILAVRYTTQAAFVYVLFAASLACLVFWWFAARDRREPARHARGVWNRLRRRVEREVSRRERAVARR